MLKVIHKPIVIIGAGPSGTTCGYLLAKAGYDCTIIDKVKFPRDKTCGGGLTPKAHKLVNDIFGDIEYEYLPVRKMEFHTAKGIFASFELNPEIRNVVREDFDEILLEEYVKVGGKLLTTRIRKIREKNGKSFLYLDDKSVISCDILVGADGANSFVRKYLKLVYPKTLLMMEKKNNDRSISDIIIYFDKKYDGGYTYVFPNMKKNIVGYGHMNATVNEFGEEIGRFGLNPEGKTKGAYIPAYESFKYPFRKTIILIGDAGGYVDSVTGEGLYYALKTGQNAAISIIEGRDFKDVNKSMIRRVKRLNRIARIFYNRAFQNLFYRICSTKFLHPWLTKIANYYVAR